VTDTLAEARLNWWQRRIFAAAWLTYASFYLGRVNLSVALPAIQSEFGWGRAEAGLIGSAFFWVYACGQLVNGQLGDVLSGRIFVGIGILTSVCLNLAFGSSNRLTVMILIWAANGYVQSMGWGPILGTLSHWFTGEKRAQVSALFAPSFVAGHVASWLISGWLVSRYTWRSAFRVPPIFMVMSGVVWILAVRDRPGLVGLTPPGGGTSTCRSRLRFRELLAHPRLRWAGTACVCMGMAKDGIILWGPTFLIDAAGIRFDRVSVVAVIIPVCGLVGTLAAGWLSARFFWSREAPVAAILLATLAAAIVALWYLVPVGRLVLLSVALGLVGAASYGANSILLTALPLGLGDQGIVSSAAGFLDFTSYLGAGLGAVLTGWLVDTGGWLVVFGYWTVAALIAALALLPTWGLRPEKHCVIAKR
jgi:OPA family glycerol-3-phosphate transporter-like MFS transporter